MADDRIEVDGREIPVSNLDKVLYPETGFTKGDVIEHYRRVAPVLLPHLRGRGVTRKRFPDGPDGTSFYEKNCPKHRPPWVPVVDFTTSNGTEIAFCAVEDEAALVWLANLAALELHAQLWRLPDTDHPTHLVFDLDPGPPAGHVAAAEVALVLRDALEATGMEVVVKSSGGKGLHLGVPLDGSATFDEAKSVAQAIAEALERQMPGQVTSVMAKAKRKGKVFIDWSQNDRHKSTVAVWSLRGRSRPTVSAPLTWDEVADAVRRDDPGGLLVEAPQIPDRLRQLGDLWAPIEGPGQPLARLLR